jgi:hypothetical protein
VSTLKSFDEQAADFCRRENLSSVMASMIAAMLEQAWCDGVAFERSATLRVNTERERIAKPVKWKGADRA